MLSCLPRPESRTRHDSPRILEKVVVTGWVEIQGDTAETSGDGVRRPLLVSCGSGGGGFM